MELSERDFRVLDTLDSHEVASQRQLAEHSGISLGQANYVIRSLLKKGLVKIGNFQRNPNKISYAYILTAKGIEAKSKLAGRFILSRLREYENLRQRITEKLIYMVQQGHFRVIFIGPDMVSDLVASIIKEKNMRVKLVSRFKKLGDLAEVDPSSYDIALFLEDGDGPSGKKINRAVDLRNRVVPLW